MEIKIGCAFCDQDVEDDVAGFTMVYRDLSQTWFGHAACFIAAMTEPYCSELRPEWRHLL